MAALFRKRTTYKQRRTNEMPQITFYKHDPIPLEMHKVLSLIHI